MAKGSGRRCNAGRRPESSSVLQRTVLNDFIQSKNLGSATFAAHSLGNMVMSAAIELDMPYRQFFMVNAAVAEEAFVPRSAYADEAGWSSNTGRLMFHPRVFPGT